MRGSRIVALLMLNAALSAVPTRAEPATQGAPPLDFGLDLRYRYEEVEQDGTPQAGEANTLRIRGRLATPGFRGFSGLLEADQVVAIGAQRYNDTRNGETGYPVVADPEGTEFNQAWLEFAPGRDTRLRIGRQRVNFDNQRFIGSSDWRQNEQTLDALRLETKAGQALEFNYAFVDRVNRVFGPDAGTPPASFEGSSHLVNARLAMPRAGALTAYAYLLDFDDAPLLSSDTFGARYEGMHSVRDRYSLGWALEYARQQDAGANPLHVDASYALVELHFKAGSADLLAGREVLSGAQENPAANRAFQTPLATLHKWQGWADKFLSTPPAGIDDSYAGVVVTRSGWRLQAAWHVFSADAGSLHYGDELDLSVARSFAKRYEVLVKFADYDADGEFTDTRKLWAQFGASF